MPFNVQGVRRGLYGVVCAIGFAFALSLSSASAQVLDIWWEDLIAPGAVDFDVNGLLIDPATPSGISYDPMFYPLNDALDRQVVKIPGYVVPLTFDGLAVNEFLLVPYVGACIHVPPPPPNQIVYVETQKPLHVEELFMPVWVTGQILLQTQTSELAYTGYTLTADAIEVISGAEPAVGFDAWMQ